MSKRKQKAAPPVSWEEAGRIIQRIRERIPPVINCFPGACFECCGPVPWSPWEWSQVPEELKAGLVVERIRVLHPLIKLKVEALMALKRPLKTEAHLLVDGLAGYMRLGAERPDLIDPDCVFIGPAGCKVYQWRPFLCRLYGTVANPRLLCSHGARAYPLMSDVESFGLVMPWYETLIVEGEVPEKIKNLVRRAWGRGRG